MLGSLLRADATRVPALARGLAKKKKKTFDLGWDQLRTELLRIPVPLPQLKSLTLASAKMDTRKGENRGARQFPLEYFAPLRFQNPDAVITNPVVQGTSSSLVIELQSGDQHTFDVSGVPSTDILRRVLEVGGMPEADVQATMDVAAPTIVPAVEAGGEEAAEPEALAEEAPVKELER